MLVYSRIVEYLENIAELRILVDIIVAYFGSFFVTAIIHFVKPN